MSEIRVLIVGTGGMANAHAEAYADMDGVTVCAGIDTSPERLAAFCAKHNIANSFASVEEALAWGEFDAVSNVTPDGVHHATTMPFLAAGKHVLCEKPLAVTVSDAEEMATAAEASGVVNMVNLSYRNGAALIRAAELVAEGAIGEVRHFEASYLQSWLTQPAWGEWSTNDTWLWRLSKAHGSKGVLGDVGVHILDFATYAACSDAESVSCNLTTFDKAPGGKIGDYTLDANDSFTLQMNLANGAVGVVHSSRMASGYFNDLFLRLHGTKGGLDVRFEGNKSILRGCLGDDLFTATWRDIEVPAVQTNYQRFIAAIRSGVQVSPDFRRGAMLQRVMDAAERSDAADARMLPV
ncbi:Gfo/Idh/MocA family protein [Pelagovum sp. HNIBRBA483]|uniref:Gfo/Idh/MocA family protein n=1 Tax=Pelagovum sp. HNIBRBA483 TaxID=3233341 RepID=UPI0034A27BA9